MIPCNKCYWYTRLEPHINTDGNVEAPDYCTNWGLLNPVDLSNLPAKEARAEAGRECKYAEYKDRHFCNHSWKIRRRYFFWKIAFCEKCCEVCK